MAPSGYLNRWDESLSTVPQVGDASHISPLESEEKRHAYAVFSRFRRQLGLDRHGMQLYDLSQLFARRTVSAANSRWLLFFHFLTSLLHFKSTSKCSVKFFSPLSK